MHNDVSNLTVFFSYNNTLLRIFVDKLQNINTTTIKFLLSLISSVMFQLEVENDCNAKYVRTRAESTVLLCLILTYDFCRKVCIKVVKFLQENCFCMYKSKNPTLLFSMTHY